VLTHAPTYCRACVSEQSSGDFIVPVPPVEHRGPWRAAGADRAPTAEGVMLHDRPEPRLSLTSAAAPGVRVGADHRMIGSRTAGHPSNRAGAARFGVQPALPRRKHNWRISVAPGRLFACIDARRKGRWRRSRDSGATTRTPTVRLAMLAREHGEQHLDDKGVLEIFGHPLLGRDRKCSR
jgi:hypothetical protein